MNSRFDCFTWNNWNALCQTENGACLTASSHGNNASKRSNPDPALCQTGTGGLSNRCLRGAPVCVSAKMGRRARRRALCDRVAVLAGEGVAA